MLFGGADDLAAKITMIEDTPQIAENYRRLAPERIRGRYSWEQITNQYEELFYQLVEGEDPTRVHSSVAEEHGREREAGLAV
jgi:glycosyltransferase involved in cell wall biosynthesis